jgi:hypothetical protein
LPLARGVAAIDRIVGSVRAHPILAVAAAGAGSRLAARGSSTGSRRGAAIYLPLRRL